MNKANVPAVSELGPVTKAKVSGIGATEINSKGTEVKEDKERTGKEAEEAEEAEEEAESSSESEGSLSKFHCLKCGGGSEEDLASECPECNGKCMDCRPLECEGEDCDKDTSRGCPACFETLECGHGPMCKDCAWQADACERCGHRQCADCVCNAFRGNCDCAHVRKEVERYAREMVEEYSSDESGEW
eukprot:gene4215-14329_t